MAVNLGLAWTKLKLSFRSVGRVLARPAYLALALGLGFIFFEIVYWAFNMSILAVVLGSGIGIGDKVIFLLSPFKDVFVTTNGFVGSLMILVAVVQGVSLSLLVYTIKHQKRLNVGAVGGGSIAGLLAVVGLGCSVCGTSLLVPVVAIFASTSAVVISEKLTVIAPLLAVIIGLVGVYYLGIQSANVNAQTKQAKQAKEGK